MPKPVKNLPTKGNCRPNLSHEYRYKNLQHNINKLNPVIFERFIKCDDVRICPKCRFFCIIQHIKNQYSTANY